MSLDTLSNVVRIPLLAFLTLSQAVAVHGQTMADRLLCRKGFLEVVSPDARKLSQSQCIAVADQALAAWRFDASKMRWADPSELEKKGLKLRLLSVKRMKAEHPGVIGFAKGRDLFVVSLAVLDDPLAQGTLAHEIAHIQAARAMRTDAYGPLAPRNFLEGHGNSLGRAYRDHLRIATHSYDKNKARKIMRMPAVKAKLIFTDNSYASAGANQRDEMEAMGIFFLEYLRTRYHGQGIPDVIPRISRIFELLGRGETFDTAFKREFGEPAGQVISEIVNFMKRTEPDPAERLKGTLYEEFSAT